MDMSNEKVQYFDSKILNPKMLNFIMFDHRSLVIKQYIDSKLFDILEDLFDNTIFTMKNIDIEYKAQTQFIFNSEEDTFLSKYNYFYILSNLTSEILDALDPSKMRYILLLNGNDSLLEHPLLKNSDRFIQTNIKLGDFPQVDIVKDTVFEEYLIKMMDPAHSENSKNEIKNILGDFNNKMFELCNYLQNSELTLAKDKIKEIQDFLKTTTYMQEPLDLVKIKAFISNYYAIPMDLLNSQFEKIASGNFELTDVQGLANIYRSIYKRTDCFGISFRQTVEFFSKAAPEMDLETFIMKMYIHDNEKISANFTGAFFLNAIAEKFKDRSPTKEELLEFISEFKDVADEIVFDMQLIPDFVERYRIEKNIDKLPAILPNAHENLEETKKFSEEFDFIVQDDEDMKKALISTIGIYDSSVSMRQSPKQSYIWLRKTRFHEGLELEFQKIIINNYLTNFRKRFPKDTDEYLIKSQVKTRFESVFSKIPRMPVRIQILTKQRSGNSPQNQNNHDLKNGVQLNSEINVDFKKALEIVCKFHGEAKGLNLDSYLKNLKIVKQYIRSFINC